VIRRLGKALALVMAILIVVAEVQRWDAKIEAAELRELAELQQRGGQ
jgi:hypothetical protein